MSFLKSFFCFGFQTIGNQKIFSIILLYIEMITILFFVVILVSFFLLFMIFFFSRDQHAYSYGLGEIREATLDGFIGMFPFFLISYFLYSGLGFIFSLTFDEQECETIFNLHIIGHQWYWSYCYDLNLFFRDEILNDFYNQVFDFFGLKNGFEMNFFSEGFGVSFYDDLNSKQIRFDSYLLDLNTESRYFFVDNNLVLPSHYHIGCFITSTDVIHSWSVPELGIKIDAIPGRLSYFLFYGSLEGVYVGQCSELCGVHHAFMPIVVEIVDLDTFYVWYFLNTSPEEVSGFFREGFSYESIES
jgi:heme/copper-type cytochrome/quinol oxidase subunit 2